jgi:phosphotransferase system enzyme I (PtsI)
MADYVRLNGVAASEGVAVGPVFVHIRSELEPERESIAADAVEEELRRFYSAVEAVTRKLSETANRMREGESESEAGIFEAHVEMAEDPEFQSEVEERVQNLESPESAVLAVGEEYASMFAAMEDEYLSARASWAVGPPG